jgi:hypothetical protein
MGTGAAGTDGSTEGLADGVGSTLAPPVGVGLLLGFVPCDVPPAFVEFEFVIAIAVTAPAAMRTATAPATIAVRRALQVPGALSGDGSGETGSVFSVAIWRS